MQESEENSTREFVGFIWIDDRPAIRLRVFAKFSKDARTKVIDEYGEGHIISLWNEDDAKKPRKSSDGKI